MVLVVMVVVAVYVYGGCGDDGGVDDGDASVPGEEVDFCGCGHVALLPAA